MEYRFKVFADYFQFSLEDDNPAAGDLSESWSEQTVADLLAVAPFTVGIGTARNMDVPVTVEIRESAPDDDFAAWDHVTEASLSVPSGRVAISGGSDSFASAHRVPVQPGTYVVRVYYAGLESVSWNGLKGKDRYRVVLWPGEPHEPLVLKRHWSAAPRPPKPRVDVDIGDDELNYLVRAASDNPGVIMFNVWGMVEGTAKVMLERRGIRAQRLNSKEVDEVLIREGLLPSDYRALRLQRDRAARGREPGLDLAMAIEYARRAKVLMDWFRSN